MTFALCSDLTLTDEIRQCLRMPTFDNWQWEDEEILLLLQHMYTDLQLTTKFPIELTVLRQFLCKVYMNYNEVPFHNFHHCFCVSQMVSKLAHYPSSHAPPPASHEVNEDFLHQESPRVIMTELYNICRCMESSAA